MSTLSVYRVGLEGKPEFKVVVSGGGITRVRNSFLARSKDLVKAKFKVMAVKHRDWAIVNRHRLEINNITIETLAENLLPGAAQLYANLYINDYPQPEHILNHKGA
ncbi:hypothetical protein ST201phi2-1p360 [Pseudomonas phage 201phi2-1]|uniref:Uncharacterized protein n=1 Tax=Pseudomonas phage 201phi2-1 TaxID=198110 RepID=B3FJM0_BP201|nr:hypothetical protein ST201phi2-1p360 [Pseudomonas phage 201phi2-1]ABY63185.1 hypothetical protein 201phi2-1p360 [Pseudomonas phage 201phi2-1]